MQLTKNFTRSELQCSCGCRRCAMDVNLLTALQSIRDNMNKPLIITSGFRCADHNKRSGGSTRSQHLVGKAVDISIKDWPIAEAYRLLSFALKESKINGFGFHELFIHIDCRDTPRTSWLY